MPKKVIILGAGLVGSAIALDLAANKKFIVSVADVSAEALSKLEKQRHSSVPDKSSGRFGISGSGAILTIRKDLRDPETVKDLVRDYDFVINSLPGFMGFQTFKTVIEAGKNIVDIAFFIEDPLPLDKLAKKNGVTALMDCGVAPGMCNVLIGYAHHLLERTDEVIYYVGGLPQVREWPYEYKAVFSPVDVIEEYTRPARFIENGKPVVKQALSDPELMDFPGIGTLEAFNTDGLRSLVHTIKAPNMKEKTLRYPGHIDKMRLLRETGFFRTDEVDIGGKKVRPIDMTTGLLFPMWKFTENDRDVTVMKVVVKGVMKNEGRRTKDVEFVWELFDKKDEKTGIHSMARTTGYTATVALEMIADGVFTRKGVIVPEYIGKQPECVEYLLKGLARRGVVYKVAKSERRKAKSEIPTIAQLP